MNTNTAKSFENKANDFYEQGMFKKEENKMDLKTIRAELLKNNEVKSEYEALEPEYELVRAVLNARKQAHLTQQQLAEKSGINRADISKLENGNANPTFAILKRLADSMDMTIKLEFIPKNKVSLV